MVNSIATRLHRRGWLIGASCFKPVLKLAEAFFVYIEPCFLFAIEAEGGRG